MALSVEFILDDRERPPAEIAAIVGETRFSGLLTRRRRLVELLRAEAEKGGAVAFHHLASAEDAALLARRIETAPQGAAVYLRMPGAIVPGTMFRLSELVDKARYARSSMLAGPVFGDEAVAVLGRDDARALLGAADRAARRAVHIALADSGETMFDHLALVDLRVPRQLLGFLAGSTEARHFNALKIAGGVMTKSSADRDKMRREYAFFHAVPEAMKRFLIPTFGYEETDARASYRMEHLVVPDVAVQVVHGALSGDDVALLLDRIFAFLAARERRAVGRREVAAAGRQQILGKMESRLADLRATAAGARLDGLLRLSGPAGGLDEMEGRAAALIAAALAEDRSDALAVSHGDPCFSNILFDGRTGLFRLIDPRGGESIEDALMHPLYDVAKVSHSILGSYDFVNSGLFACSLDDDLGLGFALQDGGVPASAAAMFEARLADGGHPLWIVRAYELSLFLSMLPLHTDHPRKLAGFAMIAAHLIETLERGRGR